MRKAVGDIVTLGDGIDAQSTLAQVPHDLVLDRVTCTVTPSSDRSAGIGLN
jgi:hypothetical protein